MRSSCSGSSRGRTPRCAAGSAKYNGRRAGAASAPARKPEPGKGTRVMPLYEYQCEKCGKRMEVILQRFSDPHPKKCDHCGGKLKKLMSSPAVQFKGSGWYVSDYGKAGTDKEETGKEEKGKEEKTQEEKGKEKETGKPAEAADKDAASAPGGDASKDAGTQRTKESDS